MKSLFSTVLVLCLCLAGVGCKQRNQETKPLTVRIELPKRYSDLTFAGIKVVTIGTRASEVSNEQAMEDPDGSKILIVEKTYYSDSESSRIAGHAVIGLSKTVDKDVVLFLCGRPPITVQYDAQSDFSITKSGESSITVVRCSPKSVANN